jgi:hypothetical protein
VGSPTAIEDSVSSAKRAAVKAQVHVLVVDLIANTAREKPEVDDRRLP